MSELAAIYLPDEDAAERWLNPCLDLVARHGYQLVAVVRGGWASVAELIRTGRVQVVVVGSRDHLPPDRQPRVEAVAEEGPAPSPRGRRPRLIRRDGEG